MYGVHASAKSVHANQESSDRWFTNTHMAMVSILAAVFNDLEERHSTTFGKVRARRARRSVEVQRRYYCIRAWFKIFGIVRRIYLSWFYVCRRRVCWLDFRFCEPEKSFTVFRRTLKPSTERAPGQAVHDSVPAWCKIFRPIRRMVCWYSGFFTSPYTHVYTHVSAVVRQTFGRLNPLTSRTPPSTFVGGRCFCT